MLSLFNHNLKREKMKTIIPTSLIVLLLIFFVPTFALAADATINSTNSPYNISSHNNPDVITIESGSTITLQGSATEVRIVCEANVSIILETVVIVNTIDDYSPIRFSSGTNFLELDGDSSLYAGENEPGLGIFNSSTTLTISDKNDDGALESYGGTRGAGIGGGDGDEIGTIIITGGEIIAEGDEGAGIGLGDAGVASGNILITGGEITANGGSFCCGIGGANESDPVTKIEIIGGKIRATGKDRAAGIGGYKHSGQIIIRGGEVTASNSTSMGAGIGGGHKGSCGDIKIYGGTIIANSMYGAGIGNGDAGNGGSIAIHGGSIEAKGMVNGAGIGGANESVNPPSVTITGGTITAEGLDNSAGIGGGYDCNGSVVNITGGTIYATGDVAGTAQDIGMGYDSTSATHQGSLFMRASNATMAVFIKNERANSVDPTDPEPDYYVINSLADIPDGVTPPAWSFPYGLYYQYKMIANPQTGNIGWLETIFDWLRLPTLFEHF